MPKENTIAKQELLKNIHKNEYKLKKRGIDYKRIVDVAVNNPPKENKMRVFEIKYKDGSELNYAQNDYNMKNIQNYVNNKFEYEELTGSDKEFTDIKFSEIESITLKHYKKTNINENKEIGGFFPYLHKTDLNLEKLGIFKTFKKDNYKQNCFIDCLQILGLEMDKINGLKIDIENTVSMKYVEELCNTYKITINIKNIYIDSNNTRTKKYGKEGKEYNIALIENHYIPIIPIHITTYALNHYEEIKYQKDYHKIYERNGKYYKKQEDKYINSDEVVRLLFKNKLLEPLTEQQKFEIPFYSNNNITYENLSDVISKPFNLEDFKKKQQNKKEKNNIKYVIFFDFETYTNKEKIVVPYMCSYTILKIDNLFEKSKIYTKIGSNCASEMMSDISNKINHKELKKEKNATILMYAHNAKFDFSFIMEEFKRIELTQANNSFKQCVGYRGSLKYIVRDTYAMIDKKLSEFPEMFNLKNVKEVMLYTLYTDYYRKNKDLRKVSLKEIQEYCKKEDKSYEEILNNFKSLGMNDDKVDMIEYSKYYCEKDVEILRDGFVIFRDWIVKCLKMDIFHICTIASLAYQYLALEGCFDETYYITGVALKFIEKCCTGGRVMTANNKKYILLSNEDKIVNLDAKSLYPSAMSILLGFIKGTLKIIKNLDYKWLEEQSYYYVEVLVKKVNKHLTFPLLSEYDESSRNWTNELEGKRIHLDKYGLNNAIKYHGLEFEILGGYYSDEGFNTKINEVIKELYDLRKKNKNNPIELVYKLLMNSAYGKLLQKVIKEKIKIFDKWDDCLKFMSKNINDVRLYHKYGNKWKVYINKSVNMHYNMVHHGSIVLSKSKEIMTEVLELAQDNNVRTYYTDTDSIYLQKDDKDKLEELFKQKYERDLIGKNMGQFDSDLVFKDKTKKVKNVVGVKSIFLGKKMYCIEMQGENENGEILTEHKIVYKGIPSDSIKDTCKKENITPIEFYKQLYEGNKKECDLLLDGKRIKLDFTRDGKIISKSKFTRTAQC